MVVGLTLPQMANVTTIPSNEYLDTSRSRINANFEALQSRILSLESQGGQDISGAVASEASARSEAVASLAAGVVEAVSLASAAVSDIVDVVESISSFPTVLHPTVDDLDGQNAILGDQSLVGYVNNLAEAVDTETSRAISAEVSIVSFLDSAFDAVADIIDEMSADFSVELSEDADAASSAIRIVNGNVLIGSTVNTGLVNGTGNVIIGTGVTGLAPDLTNNIILATNGVTQGRFDGEFWIFPGITAANQASLSAAQSVSIVSESIASAMAEEWQVESLAAVVASGGGGGGGGYVALHPAYLSYAATINLDFSVSKDFRITSAGPVTLTASNFEDGDAAEVYITGNSNGVTFSFPAGWRSFGPAIAAVPANTDVVVVLKAIGTTDIDIRYSWKTT